MALPAYRPLNPTESEIRVLTLQPSSSPDAPIHCSMSHVSLDASPSFEALSYVWGATTPRHTIILDGNPFEVGPSLQAALHALRQRKKSRTIWADAICINQMDHGEKVYQVPLMRRLYAEATSTLIWFGEANPDIDALVSWLKAHGPDRKLISGHSSTWLKLGARKLFSEKASREKDLLLLQAANGFFDILTMRYWYRMWTFQEFVLPKEEPLCYCGDHEFRMDDIGETKDRILEQVDEVRQRVDAKITALGLDADDDEPLITWLHALAKHTTALSRKSAEAQSLQSVFQVRKEFRGITGTGRRLLAYYLGMTSERECSLGHDRFYAILGIFPALKDIIPIDYEVPLRQVMLQVASYVINVEEMKEMYLCFGLLPGHLESGNKTPSWLPDFARGSDESDGSNRYHTNEFLHRMLYKAAFEKYRARLLKSW